MGQRCGRLGCFVTVLLALRIHLLVEALLAGRAAQVGRVTPGAARGAHVVVAQSVGVELRPFQVVIGVWHPAFAPPSVVLVVFAVVHAPYLEPVGGVFHYGVEERPRLHAQPGHLLFGSVLFLLAVRSRRVDVPLLRHLPPLLAAKNLAHVDVLLLPYVPFVRVTPGGRTGPLPPFDSGRRRHLV